VKLTTHFLLVPRSGMSGAIPEYVFTAWCLVTLAQGQLYLSPSPLQVNSKLEEQEAYIKFLANTKTFLVSQ